MKRVASSLLLLALVAAPAGAVSNESLRTRWLAEAQRIDALQSEYQRVSDEQAKSLQELDAARKAVDTALADPAVPSERLLELEDRLTDARDRAMRLAEDAASVRRHIYDQIELIERLGAEIEGGGEDEPLIEDTGIGGTWRAEWGKSGEFGLVRLLADGNFVSGTFRLTNGNAGSLKGTLAGGELRLEVVNSSRGFTGNVTAQVAPGGDVIEGTWMAVELTGVHRAVSGLTLTRLDPDTASELLREMR